MKTLARNLLIAVVVPSALFFSCKSNKPDTIKATNEVGKVLEGIPCEKESVSNNKFFRAGAIATSTDLNLSKEKALLLAKQRVATLIQSRIKSVTERYVNESEIQNQSDFEQKFENLTREVIDLQMGDITMNCSKTSVLEDKRYRTFLSVEISKKDFYDRVVDQTLNNKKVQIDYDKMKFEKIYNEEMERLEAERG